MTAYNDRRIYPELRLIFRVMQAVAAVGLLWSLSDLLGHTGRGAEWLTLLYATWFMLAVVCIEAILNWIRGGVYVLVIATLVVTLAEWSQGIASLGGASLAALLVLLLVAYVRPLWDQFD